MPNWSYTTVTVTGPDAKIERFKQACLFAEPTEDNNGIDFDRIIPMPKIDWPECSTLVDDALVVLGRPDLHVCFGGRDVEDKAEFVKQHPDSIAQAHLAIAAHAETGFSNSLSWACANWGTKWRPRESVYQIHERGCHELCLVTAWSPPLPVLEKIVALFPALTLDVYSRCEMGNYFIKGTISASGTDLHNDEEAMKAWDAAMQEASKAYYDEDEARDTAAELPFPF